MFPAAGFYRPRADAHQELETKNGGRPRGSRDGGQRVSQPKLIEVAGKFAELDGVWIDQEHSGLPNQELELLLIACRAAGLDAFVRVAPTDYATVMRPMEGGASGVMMAQVRSVAEVEQLVRWMKYHPEGERGLFLGSY